MCYYFAAQNNYLKAARTSVHNAILYLSPKHKTRENTHNTPNVNNL